MRPSPPVFVALSALVCAAGPSLAAQSPGTRAFEHWTASCNNLNACVILGSAADGGDLLYLRLARDAGAGAAPEAKFVIVLPDGAKGPADRFRATAVDGGKTTLLGPFPAKAAADDASTVTATIAAGADTLALIEAVRNAATLDLAIGSESGVLDLKGLSAALRFIDDRQGRVGGATALVAKGMTPVGQVPPPPSPPAVTAAPAGSASEVETPVVTDALLAAPAAICDAEVLKEHADLKAWRLGPDRILVAVPCQSGAYNFQTALYFTDDKGGSIKPVTLPQAFGLGDDSAANVLTNGDFDPKTMEIAEFAKGRGAGDCGSLTTWVWTGETFALLTSSGLDACPGALSDDWPNVYTAVKR